MSRWPVRAAALLTILLGPLPPISAQTSLPSEFQHWQWSAPIAVGADAISAGLVSVAVPVDVVGRAAADLVDLRVVDDDGRETPYILHARTGGVSGEWRTAATAEPSVVDGQFSQIVADTGERPRVHNAARLTIDGAEDFVTWVEVAASDDGRSWRVVRERTPIYSLRAAGMGENTTVTSPDILSRYARFRLLDGSRRYQIDRVELSAQTTTVTELVPSGIALERTEERDRSIWTSATGQPQMPIAVVRFETAQSTFLRVVVVERSADGRVWERVASGEIYRMLEQGQPRASLSVRTPEMAAAHWRIVVYNRSDAPLADVTPMLQSVPRRVVFRREPGRSYRLVYGNPRATRPAYDMGRLTGAAEIDGAHPAALEAARENTGYADPAPWTERHPLLLWVALGLAVAALGALAIRTMRTA